MPLIVSARNITIAPMTSSNGLASRTRDHVLAAAGDAHGIRSQTGQTARPSRVVSCSEGNVCPLGQVTVLGVVWVMAVSPEVVDGRSGAGAATQAGGPLANWTVAVCDCPDWSVQTICTLSPGWWVTRASVSAPAEVIVVPARPVMTSPVEIPASSAGSPVTTPATAAPVT